MNAKKSVKKMPAAPRIQWTVPEDKFQEFESALNHYGFWNNAHFVQACVEALIRAHKAGEDLPRELKFKAINSDGGASK